MQLFSWFLLCFSVLVPFAATLIYPLNIHLHDATNFACVRFTFLISIHSIYAYKCSWTYAPQCGLYVTYERLLHKYLSTVYSLFIRRICRFIYNFDQLNSGPSQAMGSHCPGQRPYIFKCGTGWRASARVGPPFSFKTHSPPGNGNANILLTRVKSDLPVRKGTPGKRGSNATGHAEMGALNFPGLGQEHRTHFENRNCPPHDLGKFF